MAKQKKRDGKRTRVSARKKAESRTEGFDRPSLCLPTGCQLHTIKEDGTKRYDILPYVVGKGNPNADPGEEHWERTYWVHKNVGADQETHVCLKKTFGKRCPVCEWRAQASKDEDIEASVVEGLKPKERQLFNLIDLSEPDKGVQVLEISYYLFGDQLEAEVKDSDADEGIEYFADLEEGMTLRVGWKADSFRGITFYKCRTISFKPRKKPYTEKILDEVYCLDDLIQATPYDKLKAILLEVSDEEDGDGEEKESEKKEKSSKRKGKKAKEPEPDDEDDGDWDFPDDDEPEDGSDLEEEDDDDDEEGLDDEDEPEEKPSKKKSKKTSKGKGKEKATKKSGKGKKGKKPEPEPEPDDEDDDDWDEDWDDD